MTQISSLTENGSMYAELLTVACLYHDSVNKNKYTQHLMDSKQVQDRIDKLRALVLELPHISRWVCHSPAVSS